MRHSRFTTEVVFGDQSFDLFVDTGSSDTWVPTDNFTFIDLATNRFVNQPEAEIGATFHVDSSFDPIPNGVYTEEYGGGTTVSELPGYAAVELVGLSIPKQEVNLVARVSNEN